MDKNTVIGLVLIAVVLIGFSFYSTNTQKQQAAQPAPQENLSQAQEKQEARQDADRAAAALDSTALFHEALTGKNEKIVLKNNKVTVTINSKGGTVSEVRLNEYKGYADYKEGRDNPLLLYAEKDASLSFVLETKDNNIRTGNYYFTPVGATDSTVTMLLRSPGGETLQFDYKLLADNYLLNFSVKTTGMERHISPQTEALRLYWRDKVRQQEKGFYFENMYSTLTYKPVDDGAEKLNEHETEEAKAEGKVDWIAFKNQYFSSILMAEQSFSDVEMKSVQEGEYSGYLKDYSASMNVPFDASGRQATRLQFYFGPNQYRLLQSMDAHKLGEKDMDLEEVVYLGWPIFKWINRYFTIYVFDWLTQLGLPMGIVLLLITLLLRVIVYVPTRKSYMSSARMRVLKPKVDEISKKYPNKEDAMKRQQEMMTLYSQYGVSPMGGCLPMLLQMPIWIAMFNFVPNAIELRQQGFLWADDLSTYDDVLTWGVNLPFIGNHLSLFCVLFCATNVIYSVMTMRQQRAAMSGEQAEQMKLMQWMMFLMPVFFFFMFNKYPAGLNYYYFISLLASALTMWYLRRTTDDKKILAKLEANYEANKNNPNKKPSGLAARLEALQKQQEAMMEAQKRMKK